MPFIIEFRNSSNNEFSQHLTKLENKLMTTLSEIQAAIEALDVTVESEKAEVTAKIASLTESVEALKGAVAQLQGELAAANDPATLQAIADKISELSVEISGFVVE
jgi:DNA repair exonuclease SbcCD ATPase subunit